MADHDVDLHLSWFFWVTNLTSTEDDADVPQAVLYQQLIMKTGAVLTI